MASYNVLALDGGGCRGVITAALISALNGRAAGFLRNVDLFAGTSVGAGNALFLAGRAAPPSEMVDFYREFGRVLFEKRYRPPGVVGWLVSTLRTLPGIGGLVDEVDALFDPKWSNEGLRRALATRYGNTTMRDLPALALATTLRMGGHDAGSRASVVEPIVMTNRPDSPFLDLPVTEVLLRSMSAPTLFESAPGGFVDGGVFANAPALAAVGIALREGRALEDIRVLSIGTGFHADGVPSKSPLAWGAIEWGRRFPEISLHAVGEFDRMQCSALLGARGYHRLDVQLPRPIAADAWESIDEMIEIANEAIGTPPFNRALTFIEDHFMTA